MSAAARPAAAPRLALQIVTASTRPGRKGPEVAAWASRVAREQDLFDVEDVDLASFGLPLFDEPDHPRLQTYRHAHTRAWSETVARADAFVFVTPEYNHSPPPSLLNALAYLVREWEGKPVGLVSYGGLSGGLRAVQGLRPTLTALGMMPLPDVVALPRFTQHLDEARPEGERFAPGEGSEVAMRTLVAALRRWAGPLSAMRQAS